MLNKQLARKKRHQRIRAKISGTKQRPRVCSFRSNKHFYLQLIDDQEGKVLAMASDFEIKEKNKLTKIELAEKVGQNLAAKAEKLGIKEAVFDKAGYKYHGRVSAAAKGLRDKGLKI